MQFSFRHAALIASVLLGVLATVSLTLYLNGGDKGKPPSDSQSQPDEEELENFVQFSPPRTVPDISFDLLLPSGEVEKVGLARFQDEVVVVNFWATWCAPCIKELPYFEELNKLENVDVLLVSLDFPKHKEKRLIPFVEKHKLQSKVVHLDDEDENYWINEISAMWSGALPASLIYSQNRRRFYEQSFTKDELFNEVKSYF